MPVPLSIRRFLNFRSATCPSFSPDGEFISFITNITGVPQVWKVSRYGGWPEQLTFYSERVSQAAFSPTRDLLAFSMDTGGNERAQLYTVTGDGHVVTRLTSDEQAISQLGPWSPGGETLAFFSNRRNPEFFDVYLAETTSGDIWPLIEEDASDLPLCWVDHEHLLVQRIITNLDSSLFLLNVASDKSRCLSPGPASYRCAFAHGGWIYLVTDWNQDKAGVARLGLQGEFEYLWAPEYEVENLAVGPGGEMAASLNQNGVSFLYLGTSRGELPELAPVGQLPQGVIHDIAFSPEGSFVTFSLSTPTHPSDIWVLDADDTATRRVTRSSRSGVPAERLSIPEPIVYPAHDGLEIPALLYLPTEDVPPHPVIIDIHGGPESQRRPEMDPVIQYLVHRGYAVLSPNVRGSSGYGRRYLAMDDVERRMDAVRDIEQAALWVREHPHLDHARVAVMGASYGGFMVLSCLVTYPHLFAAGVDLVGIANFETFLENTGPWRRRLREAEYGSLETHREFLRSISPLHKADHIRAPLLVIHGANDPRVPPGEAEQIVQTLTGQGKPVEHLVFPDEGHGLVKLDNRLRAYGRVAEFLDLHLG